MKNEIEIYSGKRGVEMKVKFEKETIWLSAEQIAELFSTQRPAISKHLKNIYQTKELDEGSTCSILEHVGGGDKQKRQYKTKFYNLDVIISVGYRVNSKKATKFRVWATQKLRNYLLNGYLLDRKKLSAAYSKFEEIRNTLLLIGEKSRFAELSGQEKNLLDIIGEYAKTFDLLERYDQGKLEVGRVNKYLKFTLEREDCLRVVESLQRCLAKKKTASELFGKSVGDKISGVVRLINQTFDGVDLYPSIEEKAANLLYFVIKDHPFLDGNKRIGSILFLYFLEKNGYLYKPSGERKINDNALTALSLLVAVSDPRDKDNLINLVINLIRVN